MWPALKDKMAVLRRVFGSVALYQFLMHRHQPKCPARMSASTLSTSTPSSCQMASHTLRWVHVPNWPNVSQIVNIHQTYPTKRCLSSGTSLRVTGVYLLRTRLTSTPERLRAFQLPGAEMGRRSLRRMSVRLESPSARQLTLS